MYTAFVGDILQMAIRTSILGNVCDNQPSPRELPEVPKFHSEQPVDRKTLFTASLKELAGEVVTDPPADFDNFLKERTGPPLPYKSIMAQ